MWRALKWTLSYIGKLHVACIPSSFTVLKTDKGKVREVSRSSHIFKMVDGIHVTAKVASLGATPNIDQPCVVVRSCEVDSPAPAQRIPRRPDVHRRGTRESQVRYWTSTEMRRGLASSRLGNNTANMPCLYEAAGFS